MTRYRWRDAAGLCWHHSVLYYWWRTLLLVLITDGLMVIILPFAIHSMPRIFLKCNSKLDTCIFKALQGLPHAPQNKAQRSQSAIFKGCSDLPWTSLSDTLPGRCFQTTSGTSLASLLTTHTLCFSYLLCQKFPLFFLPVETPLIFQIPLG